MKTEIVVCDNPTCNQTTYDRYGWIVGKLTWVGHGPTVEIEVCDVDCLADGVDAVRERQLRAEEEAQDAYSEQLRLLILSVPCETCAAQPGTQCISKHGKVQPKPHAARRSAGLQFVGKSDD